MASKSKHWAVDSGILRKKAASDEDAQELLIFGYSCKLFRDDEKAKLIDQGKHLIPWMGDSTLKIDRYDGRGALGDLRIYEPPSGGFDLRTILSEDEYKVEQLCDEERYRSLYNNEAEEAMYHEEELKRLHQALGSENSYSQVGFNYDEEKKSEEESQSPKPSEGSQEEDGVFVPDPELEIPEGMKVPETQKLNAIIVKTALFISQQGSQMEILIKTKQADNPQFVFLSIDGELHPYYKHVLEAIKSGKYNPEKQPDKEEPAPEEESDGEDEPYLHPSLVSSLKVEAAPSIPSINYKPSADCAYSMLVNKITGKPPVLKAQQQQQQQQQQQPQQQPEIIPPPPMPPIGYYHPITGAYQPYPTPQQYTHGPVLYNTNGSMPMPQPGIPPMPSVGPTIPVPTPVAAVQPSQTPQKEPPTPLVPYGPTPPKPLNRPSFIVPPADVQVIIDKMASYVAKNGRDFEGLVRNKGDPRFSFLELSHQYHGYYAHKLTIYEGAINPRVLTEEELLQKQELQEEKQKKLEELQKKQQRMEEVQKRVKMIQEKKKGEVGSSKQSSPTRQVTTVSFSIKKPKEGEAAVIEKRNALPVEESDDEEVNNDDAKKESTSKPASPAQALDDKIGKLSSPRVEKELVASEKPVQTERKRRSPTKPVSVANKSVATERKTVTKTPPAPPKPPNISDRTALVDKKSSVIDKKPAPSPVDITDIVDLTDDIFDDCQEIHSKSIDNRTKSRTLVTAREKVNISREKQLQLERRRKAAMFLSQIQAPIIAREKQQSRQEPLQLAPAALREEAATTIPVAPSPPNREELEIEELRMCTNTLMSRLRGPEINRRRSKQRSRSRSSSAEYSDRHKSHKKHKKKKSSHKSSYRESVSSSRSHKSKKSKKSSSRHRSRSRSPHRYYSSSSRHRRSRESSSSDSDSTSS